MNTDHTLRGIVLLGFLAMVVTNPVHAQFPWQQPVKRDPAEIERIVGPQVQRVPTRDLTVVWVWGVDKLHARETHEYAWVLDRYMNVLLAQVRRLTVIPSMYFPKPELWEKADLVVFYWNGKDLQRKLDEFESCFNEVRVHAGIGGKAPDQHGEPTESKIASLDHYRWQSHCHGLFEMPAAA